MLAVIAGIGGGLALFLFGLQVVSESLQKTAGGFLRGILRLVTRSPAKGVLTGVFITLCTQSSSATTVLLISFVQAGLLQVSQSIGVILGADIGTTVTVQLIAFRISDYALMIVAAGFLLHALSRYEREKFAGRAIFGFGLIFTGMLLMSEGTGPLRDSEKFLNALVLLRDYPLLSLFASTLITAVIQSSAATIAVAITLASQGFLGTDHLEIAMMSIPIIFGANIGTCATALLAGLQSGPGGKCVAMAHLFIKIAGVLIFIPFTRWFAMASIRLSELISGGQLSEARLLANTHTLFNLLVVLVLFPFSGIIAVLSSRCLGAGDKEAGKPDSFLLNTPEAALSWASDRIESMFSSLQTMFSNTITVLREGSRRLLEDTARMDETIDAFNEDIVMLLTKLTRKSLSSSEAGREMLFISISNQIESTADMINREILFLSRKVIEKDLSFSFEGFGEIQQLHRIVGENLAIVREAFEKKDSSMLEGIHERNRRLGELQDRSYLRHLDRLHKGISAAYSTEDVHFHLLLSFEGINSRITKIAENISKSGLF